MATGAATKSYNDYLYKSDLNMMFRSDFFVNRTLVNVSIFSIVSWDDLFFECCYFIYNAKVLAQGDIYHSLV